MRKKDRVIIKFKCRKQKHCVLYNCKALQNKSLNLTQLKFLGKLFVNESMCHENHQLAYKCHQLKSAGEIHSTWLYNTALQIRASQRSITANLWSLTAHIYYVMIIVTGDFSKSFYYCHYYFLEILLNDLELVFLEFKHLRKTQNKFVFFLSVQFLLVVSS